MARPSQSTEMLGAVAGNPPLWPKRMTLLWHTGGVVDRAFADASLAELYDLFCPFEPRGDFRFYLPLVMSAQAVLDVGCGTGALLHRARQIGHAGRLCGRDPA